jgi:hypothetical protein
MIKNNLSKITLLLVILFIIKLLAIISFEDVGWEPDSYQHFNEAATVFKDFPNNLVIGIGVWAKPLYTYPMGLIATIFGSGSLFALQVVNLIIFTLISYLVYKISLKLFKDEKVALAQAALTSLSFILFTSSLTALTEPIFTLMLILGFYFTVEGRYRLAGLFYALSVLGRIEGLFFVGIFNLWLLWKLRKEIKSKWLEVLTIWMITIVPTLIWNLLGYIDTGRIFYIFDNGYPTDSEAFYGTGSWSYYFTRMLTQEGIISLLLGFSIVVLIKKYRTYKYRKEIVLAAIFALGFFATQVITWKFGLFGSAGLMRYFISILPFMIIVSGIGLDDLTQYIPRVKKGEIALSTLFLSLIVLLQVTITTVHFVGIGPIESKWIQLEHEEFRETGEWISANISDDTYLNTDRPEIIYYSGRDLQHSTIFPSSDLSLNESGIHAWTLSWGEAVSGIELTNLEAKSDLIQKFGNEVYIFQTY